MKKILLTALCASLILSSVSATVYASADTTTEETATETTKITDLDEIAGILTPYVKENYPDASVSINEGFNRVELHLGRVSDLEFKKAVENITPFLKENNIDESSVFCTMLADNSDKTIEPTEITATETTKITDLHEIYNMLKNFIDGSYPNADWGWIGIIDEDSECPIVSIAFDWEAREYVYSPLYGKDLDLDGFMKENNIDESKVFYAAAISTPDEVRNTDPTETTSLSSTEPTTTTTSTTTETTETTTSTTSITTSTTITSTTATTETKQVEVLGDLNGDKIIDSKDAVIILKDYAENLVDKSKELNLSGDINKDGNVDSKDAVLILRYYASNLAGTYNGPIENFK